MTRARQRDSRLDGNRSRQDCPHPADRTSPAILNDDATYCGACSSLIFDDGHIERVGIDSVRRTKR